MDALLVMIGNWRTTLLGLILGFTIYEASVGNKMPTNKQEWWALAVGMLAAAIGFAMKDARVGSRPPVVLLMLGAAALAGCSMMPIHLDQMTPEQISAYAKLKDASIMCIIANTPYGKATAVYANVDKGVVPNGSVTVDDQCKTTITNAVPAAAK